MSTATASFPHLDSALADLANKKRQWHTLWTKHLLELLVRLRRDYAQVAERWVEMSCQAKGIDAHAPRAAEEWLGGPFCVLRNLRLLEQSLREIERFGRPSPPRLPRRLPNGQVTVDLLPADFYDRLFYRGFSAEIRLQPEVTLENLADHQALPHQTHPQGRLCLVLGAGNVSSIGPMDVLYKVFNEKKSVLLKMHPVNEYLGPLIEEGFQALIEHDLLRIVYGGAEEGSYLCHHPAVDEIHITGSDKTHDAIVYGAGAEGRRRKEDDEPLLDKPITSELGNVSPVIVVPGPWSRSDLAFQAANLASMLANNAGFNCNAARVIIQQGGWDQRGDLLEALRRQLGRLPTRQAYYPGARERWERHRQGHPQAETFGNTDPGQLPWTLIPDLPHDQDDVNFTDEAFCGLLCETALPASSPAEFVRQAADFCNQRLWGTLNAALLVHPESLLDSETAAAVDEAVDGLRYGTVAVNHWPAVGYGLVSTSWGAYPGHTYRNIQSGIGVVHNSYMYSSIEKSVVRGPFRVSPKPAWFVNHRRAHRLARHLTRLEASPSLKHLPAIFWNALRG
ncbi:MAG TPA: aldehyde dehydrogenase family protein [Acidobacteriota bacterium]|nr:aldehyde dehydrogenase family protein [Acidobacteriota bacterium]